MTTSTAAALAATGWSWTPAGHASPVLSGLDLSIRPGQRVLVLGASGSGKSTLLQAWAGVLGGADEGESIGGLTVDGVDPQTARGRVGLVLQDPDAQLVLARAADDVAFGPENLGESAPQILAAVPRALETVGLAALADADTRRLSGGQQQRLALAGVLAMRPAALLLDEPTAQLDPSGVREIAAAVAALADETQLTLVVVEHRVDVWAPLVDRVVVLDAGRVVADGPTADVLREQGAHLAQRGVWVAGHGPEHPSATSAAPGHEVLRTRGLTVQPTGGAVIGFDGGIDLAVRAGEVVALTGPNGAGKSTVLMTLAGLLPAAAGTIEALGTGDPARWSSAELASRFGVVFQNPEHQFVASSVRGELEIGGADAARVETVLDRLRLRHVAGVSPYSLSGGEQRRLSVATALAPQPPVLLLDEPTFGQDSRTWAELAALLAEHRDRGGAIVMATHDRELIEALDAREVALPHRDHDAPVAAPTPASRAERINPVAAIAASLIPALVLVSTLDLVSAAVALGLQLVLIPLLGVPARTLVRRLAPLFIAAPLAAATVVFYGRTSGTVYVEFLLVRISDGSLELALATLLRILAVGVPAIALFARPDATRWGDALGQNLRLPNRFVLGAVAALRLLTVLRDDARVLERARRARGLADRGRVRRALGLVFALLVLSIRRGSALAIGMEARGVGAPGPRTWVRPSPWRASDTLVVVIGVGISVIAIVASLLAGRFTGVFG